MKMAPSITVSMIKPSSSWPVMAPPPDGCAGSYLHLLLVLELDARARCVQALDRFGNALDQQQETAHRHHRLERPQHRPPGGLLGRFHDLPGVGRLVEADEEQDDQRWE